MQQQNFTPLYPPLQVRAGVLVVDGFGIALRVQLRQAARGGRDRQAAPIDHARSRGQRPRTPGADRPRRACQPGGLAWLRAIGAALVQIGRDGEVLAHSVPFGYDGHPIRRAQALAVTNGLDLDDRARADRGQARRAAPESRSAWRRSARVRHAASFARFGRFDRARARDRGECCGALLRSVARTCRFAFASATSHESRHAGCATIRARRC